MRALLFIILFLPIFSFAGETFTYDYDAHNLKLKGISRNGVMVDGRFMISFDYPAPNKGQDGEELVDNTQIDFYLLGENGEWSSYSQFVIPGSDRFHIEAIFHSTVYEYGAIVTTTYLNGDVHQTLRNNGNRFFIWYETECVETFDKYEEWYLGRISTKDGFTSDLFVEAETVEDDFSLTLLTPDGPIFAPVELRAGLNNIDLNDYFEDTSGLLYAHAESESLQAQVYINSNSGVAVQGAKPVTETTNHSVIIPSVSANGYDGLWLNVASPEGGVVSFRRDGEIVDVIHLNTGHSQLVHLSHPDDWNVVGRAIPVIGDTASILEVQSESPISISMFLVNGSTITPFQ